MNTMLAPLFAMTFLTFLVLLSLLIFRVSTILKKRIHPQKLADADYQAQVFKKGTNLSDHLENLFEVPVLFYTVCLLLEFKGWSNPSVIKLAWIYVIFRCFHTLIHCTLNIVRLRFMFFFCSNITLVILWIKAVQRIF